MIFIEQDQKTNKLSDLITKFDSRIRSKSFQEFNKPIQHDLWPEDLFKLPENVLAGPKHISNSAIFTVRNKREPRRSIQNKKIFVLGDVDISYTGIELRAQDDELVWLQIIELAKHQAVESWVNFTPYQLCKAIGWHPNGTYYKKIHACLLRLKATAIRIRMKAEKKGKAFSMISDFEWQDTYHRVKISDGLQTLFMGGQFSHLQWTEYRRLTPIARRLYDYAASHKVPFPLKLETIFSLCDSSVNSAHKWKQLIKRACKELEESALLSVVEIQIINKSELVYFER